MITTIKAKQKIEIKCADRRIALGNPPERKERKKERKGHTHTHTKYMK